mgnify:CR=1 FL=1
MAIRGNLTSSNGRALTHANADQYWIPSPDPIEDRANAIRITMYREFLEAQRRMGDPQKHSNADFFRTLDEKPDEVIIAFRAMQTIGAPKDFKALN